MLGACIRDLALDLREERDVSSRLRTSSVSSRHLDIYQNLQPQHTYTARCSGRLVGRSDGRLEPPRPSALPGSRLLLSPVHFRRIRLLDPRLKYTLSLCRNTSSLSPQTLLSFLETPLETLPARSLPALSVTARLDSTNPRPVGHFRGQFHNANNKYFTEPNKIRDDDEQLLPLT